MSQTIYLPSELEREIFTTAALQYKQCAPVLTVLCKRAQIWIEPILYHDVVLTSPRQVSRLRGCLDARPHAFFLQHVRRIYLDRCVPPSDAVRLLSICTQVTDLICWFVGYRHAGLVDCILSLPSLKSLSIDFDNYTALFRPQTHPTSAGGPGERHTPGLSITGGASDSTTSTLAISDCHGGPFRVDLPAISMSEPTSKISAARAPTARTSDTTFTSLTRLSITNFIPTSKHPTIPYLDSAHFPRLTRFRMAFYADSQFFEAIRLALLSLDSCCTPDVSADGSATRCHQARHVELVHQGMVPESLGCMLKRHDILQGEKWDRELEGSRKAVLETCLRGGTKLRVIAQSTGLSMDSEWGVPM